MNQSYSLILIVLACGFAQIHCNSVSIRNEWDDAAKLLDEITNKANFLLNISGLQVERTNILIQEIAQKVIVYAQEQIDTNMDLAFLDLNEWKELTVSFGLDPLGCVTGQENTLKQMSIRYKQNMDSCRSSVLTGPIRQINSIVQTIKTQKSIIDNLYDQFYACDQDATCLGLLYPQISTADQYNIQIRDQIFSVEEVLGQVQEIVNSGCVTATLEQVKEDILNVLKSSHECLKNAITLLKK